jgi:plasmid stability protein
VHALCGQVAMTQLTIRRLDPTVIEKLKERAAAAGRSMEEEARRIISETVLEEQLARQRAWVASMRKLHKQLYGGKVFPDSTPLIRKMREERSRQAASWLKPMRKK